MFRPEFCFGDVGSMGDGRLICSVTEEEGSGEGVTISGNLSETRAKDGNTDAGSPKTGIILGAVLCLALAAGAVAVILKRKKMALTDGNEKRREATGNEKRKENTGLMDGNAGKAIVAIAEKGSASVGKVHHIGRRNSQQDSLGVAEYPNGICAVVADGMGGLADGDKVSRKIVRTMMQDAGGLRAGATDGMLYRMVSHANFEVNRMLGVSDKYRSGSTLTAVLAEAGSFQWISVGDSRIYLYRGGGLLQLNREHIYKADLLRRAVNRDISFEAVVKNPQRKSVSSFIGMGELKYIDGSLHPVRVQSGDRLLLMSDGVFNTISEEEICMVLSREKNAGEAARALEREVLSRQNPKQDNFTAIIINM